jgi:hypothetical protein
MIAGLLTFDVRQSAGSGTALKSEKVAVHFERAEAVLGRGWKPYSAS